MLNRFIRLATDEEGGTATEYGLIAALIAAAIIGAVSALGTEVSNAFTDVTTAMAGVNTSGTP